MSDADMESEVDENLKKPEIQSCHSRRCLVQESKPEIQHVMNHRSLHSPSIYAKLKTKAIDGFRTRSLTSEVERVPASRMIQFLLEGYQMGPLPEYETLGTQDGAGWGNMSARKEDPQCFDIAH